MVKKTQSIVELARPTIPLAAATSKLAAVMNRIDGGEEISAALQAEFHESRLVEVESIDETIAFREFLDAAEAHANLVAGEWEKRKDQIARMRDSLDGQVMRAIKAADPEGKRVFRGSIGGLKIKYKPPALKCEWGSNTIDENIIFEFGVDQQFYEATVIPPQPAKVEYKLKTNDVKKYLAQEGVTLPWAKTTRGEKVEVTK